MQGLMQIVLTGHTVAARQIQAATLAGPMAGARALYDEMVKVIDAARTDFVPVETGALRDSAFIEPPVMTERGATFRFGFGGPNAPYAVIQHEDLTYRHKVGQAKYLELPLKARLGGMAMVLAMRINDGVRQAIQRLGKIEANVAAGRPVHWGMPLFRGGDASGATG